MAQRQIGIILNGVTGRIGTTQHLRYLQEIRAEGGLALAKGDRLMPELLLVGRDAARLEALAAANGRLRWTTDLGAALAGPSEIFMDCAATGGRPERVRQALAVGKHVHLEKPTAPTTGIALDLARRAAAAGVKGGVIQDKLFLPGFARLKSLSESGFFGRIVSIRIDAGSWIFDGEDIAAQRPSWNYRKTQGGGLALDMFSHWRYMIDRLVAPVTGISALLATAVPTRVDEAGSRYDVDVEDTAHALLRLQNGAVGIIANSWASRVRRDDTMVVQIDGTLGSASAGRHRCVVQSLADTPDAFFGGGARATLDFRAGWTDAPEVAEPPPPFRQCWELFLRHVAEDAPYLPTLLEAAKSVQLAELAHRSQEERRWLDVPELAL